MGELALQNKAKGVIAFSNIRNLNVCQCKCFLSTFSSHRGSRFLIIFSVAEITQRKINPKCRKCLSCHIKNAIRV